MVILKYTAQNIIQTVSTYVVWHLFVSYSIFVWKYVTLYTL